jgi:apolipoprotein N-acyltransferase
MTEGTASRRADDASSDRRSRRREFVAALGAGLAFAVLFGLSFPPFGLIGLALLAPAPLLALARWTSRPGLAGLGVAIAAVPMWAVHHVWIWNVTAAGFIPMLLVLGLYVGAAVWTVRGLWWAIGRVLPSGRASNAAYWAVLPIAWVAVEWLRGEVAFDGYPWFLLGHPLIDTAWVGEHMPASLGQYGVSLIAATVSVLVVPAIAARSRGAVTLAVVPVALAIAVTAMSFAVPKRTPAVARAAEDGAVRIGVVQTNVPQNNKLDWSPAQQQADFVSFLEQTRAVIESGEVDLIVWPETMFPGRSLEDDVLREIARSERASGRRPDQQLDIVFAVVLLQLQESAGVPMIVGAIGWDGFRVLEGGAIDAEGVFNSAMLIDGATVVDRYDKVHLTPFGEVMPYISAVDWLEKALLAIGAQGMTFELDAGERLEPLAVRGLGGGAGEGAGLRVATPICFEMTNARVVRDLVFDGGERKAGVIAQLTNDGWFDGWTGGKEHHLLLARWRAAELRTPVVRAANTGISAHIDGRGRVIERLDDRAAQTMVALVDVAEGGPTLTARLPNAAGWGSAIVAGAVLLAGIGHRLALGRGGPTSEPGARGGADQETR